MIKILIADDEVPIREWMAFSIGQMDLPCEIAGVAADGNEALALFQRHRPHLLFTDIKMPGMDGIELTRKVREIDAKARVVFLTSHSDFAFAREALQLGVDAYILKTEIRAESIAEQIVACQGKSDDAFSLQVRRQSFVPTLLGGGFPTEEQVADELAAIGFGLQNGPLAAIAVPLPSPVFEDLSVPKHGMSGEGAFENLCCLSYKPDILLIVANLPQIPSTLLQTQALSQFADAVRSYFHAPVCVSNLHTGFAHLKNAFDESIDCLNLLFYDPPKNQRQFYGSRIVTDSGSLKEKADNLLGKLESEPAASVLQALLNYLGEIRSTDLCTVKDCVVHLLNAVTAGAIKNTAVFLEAAQEIDAAVAGAPTFSQLRKTAEELLSRLEQGWNPQPSRTYSMHVHLAMEYVHGHYDQNPSLTDASEHVGVSGEHLSRLFKQEAGTTFVGYLTAYRMDRAMELLKTTNLKIYEVAERTGYSNLSYFSKSFKKQFGCNPFQIRSRGQNITTT